jgi:hypothetical protein
MSPIEFAQTVLARLYPAHIWVDDTGVRLKTPPPITVYNALWYAFAPCYRWWCGACNIVRKYRGTWRKDYRYHCPRCYESFDWAEEPWFQSTKGGSYGSDSGTVHWFEGIQTCPRCYHTWEYGDSSA